jgi:hypothetical protein
VLVAAIAPIEDVVRGVIELRTGERPESLRAAGRWRKMAHDAMGRFNAGFTGAAG